jgi:hypothetical protein
MSPRASTRLKGRPRISLAATTSDNEDKEFVENEVAALAKPTRGKKRKTLETTKEGKAAGSSKTQKLRGNRGLLQALVEMPLDILFEVCNPHRCSLHENGPSLQENLTPLPRYLAVWNHSTYYIFRVLRKPCGDFS